MTSPTPRKGWQSLEWNLGPLALGLSSEGPLLLLPGPSLCFLDHLQLSMCHLLWPLWPLITSSYIAPTAHPGFRLRVAVISRKDLRVGTGVTVFGAWGSGVVDLGCKPSCV